MSNCYSTPAPSPFNQVTMATLNAAPHHFDGHTGKVLISDGSVVALHHVYSFSGKAVDDRHVGLKRDRLLRLQDERADAAVKLRGQQQVNDGGLDVLLLILVCIERVPQVLGNILCKGKGKFPSKFCTNRLYIRLCEMTGWNNASRSSKSSLGSLFPCVLLSPAPMTTVIIMTATSRSL